VSTDHAQIHPLTLVETWDILQHLFEVECGATPESPGDSIVEFFKSHPPDDLLGFIAWIGEEFDLKGGWWSVMDEFFGPLGEWGSARWEDQVAPRLTFASLLQFIHERTPKFEPVEIAGHRCASAGVFLALRQIVENRCGVRTRFAPSTPIRDVLRGRRLRRLWERLGWWTDGGIAPLSKPWERPFRLAWLALFSLPCHWLTWRASLGWVAGVLILEWLTRWWIAERIDRAVNPLPPNLTTFRDLAEYLCPVH
jgi:hypothetical protein